MLFIINKDYKVIYLIFDKSWVSLTHTWKICSCCNVLSSLLILQKCAKKQISFDIIWIAILNKAEPKDKIKSDSMRSLKVKEKVRSSVTFSIYKINIIKIKSYKESVNLLGTLKQRILINLKTSKIYYKQRFTWVFTSLWVFT